MTSDFPTPSHARLYEANERVLKAEGERDEARRARVASREVLCDVLGVLAAECRRSLFSAAELLGLGRQPTDLEVLDVVACDIAERARAELEEKVQS